MLRTVNNNRNGSDTENIGDSKAAEHVTDGELLADEDTSELLMLDMAAFADGAHISGESTDNASVSRAATWMRDVGGEVERLQTRWESLDNTLLEANHRTVSLQAEVDGKDTKLAELVADLDTMQQRTVALEAAAAERDATITSLELASIERGEELAAVSRSLAEANGRAGVFEDRLQAAKHEVEELRRSVQDAKSSEAALRAEKETVSESHVSLRARLQDLESYVDGRREKWIEQQATLKSRKSEISSLEAALASSESRFAERDATIKSLQARIGKLERESGELKGRHRERGAAQQEAQGLLQERIGEIERLKAQLDKGNVGAGKAELDALKTSLAEKDESIRCLEVDFGKFEAVRTHIEEQQQADRKTINELQQELAQLQMQRDQLTASLDDDRAKTCSLSEKLEAAERASSELLEEREAQKERISILEAELEMRMEIIAGFDANAERLNQLSRNLHAMDNLSMNEEGYAQDLLEAVAKFNSEDASEHTETKLDISDRDLERVRHGKHAIDDGIPADLGLHDCAGKKQRHAMVALSGAGRIVYAISKPVTTIGRSEASDIRIRDAVISRIHARLRMDDEGLIIEDPGSKNGLAVNHKIIERAVLMHGDIVSLGMHDFRYLDLEQRGNTH